jgi:hypothetical protein
MGLCMDAFLSGNFFYHNWLERCAGMVSWVHLSQGKPECMGWPGGNLDRHL